jgi:hypothetical protein
MPSLNPFVPPQMFDHELNPVKGWPQPHALDKSKPIAAGALTINRGMVCHIDPATNAVKPGAPSNAVAMFAFPGDSDFDVRSDVGNIAGGNMMGLVALGALEVETTEYVGAGFTPNTPLTVVNVGADLGKVTPTAYKSGASIVGYVSDPGPLTNDFRKTVVRFWTAFIPGAVNA